VAGRQAVLFLKKKNQKNFSPLVAKPRPINPVIASAAQRLRWRPCEAIQYFLFLYRPRPKHLAGPQTAEPHPKPKPNGKKFFWFFFRRSRLAGAFKKRTSCLPVTCLPFAS
jgi:hypothetical protein